MSSIQAKPLPGEERAYEVVSLAFASVMIFVSILVILLNFRLIRRISTAKNQVNDKKLRKLLTKAKAAVKTGMLSAIETVILAVEAGMTMEDVRLEYVNTSGNREDILESVFGKTKDKFFSRLKISGRFMDTGYANEKVFVDLWKIESYREMVMTQQRAECRTQTFLLPVDVVDPASSQSNNAQSNVDTKKDNPDRSPSRVAPNQKRQSVREAKKSILKPEGRPFLCSGKNDDAQ